MNSNWKPTSKEQADTSAGTQSEQDKPDITPSPPVTKSKPGPKPKIKTEPEPEKDANKNFAMAINPKTKDLDGLYIIHVTHEMEDRLKKIPPVSSSNRFQYYSLLNRLDHSIIVAFSLFGDQIVTSTEDDGNEDYYIGVMLESLAMYVGQHGKDCEAENYPKEINRLMNIGALVIRNRKLAPGLDIIMNIAGEYKRKCSRNL